MSSRPGSMRNSGRSRQGQCHLRFHRLQGSQIGQDKVSIILDFIDYQVYRSVKTRLVSSQIPQITRLIDRTRQGQSNLRFHRLLGLQIGQDKVSVILDSIDYQVYRSAKPRLVSSQIPQITRFIDRSRQGQCHLRFHRLLGLQIVQDKVSVILDIKLF